MPNDDETLTAMGTLLMIISDARELADKIEAVMNETPNAPAYGFPAENVAKIVNSLRLNASLATNLFEENQRVQDHIMTLMNNVARKKEQ